MAAIDPVFEGLPPCRSKEIVFRVWRVEKLKLVPVPEESYGKFYGGDSYLVYWDRDGRTDIFFWLGSETSQDEQGVAAIKAVELDDLQGGSPVQHRETQGAESDDFKSAFPNGLVVLAGGVDSGMKKVDKTHVTKLYKVAGGKHPVFMEVGLSWSSMNHGDVFILDAGTSIFLWRGRQSSMAEKRTGGQMAGILKDRPGEQVIIVEDGEEEELEGAQKEAWTNALPLEGRGDILEKVEGEDEKIATAKKQAVKLHKCSDEDGEMKVSLIKSGDLKKEDLGTLDSYVVDGGACLGVWLWVGKKASPAERKEGINIAMRFIKDNDYPPATPLTRVVEQGETPQFKTLFNQWI